jgi:putative ABC transport system ATP-binding protein
MLQIQDLVKHYKLGDGEPVRAVDGVSLAVAPGELVAIYGPSGSGKTTLLELIAALRTPDGGTVLIEGRDIFGLSPRELDAYRLGELGIVGHPQNLIPGARAIENASLKLWLTNTRKARQQIEPLLDRLGLGDRLEHRTEQLSMGERQRVLIAQALATGPKLVLADEPTGNLDSHRTEEVLGLLRAFCDERQMALVLATHDPQAAAFADSVYDLRDGQLTKRRPTAVPVLDPSAVPALDPSAMSAADSAESAALGVSCAAEQQRAASQPSPGC